MISRAAKSKINRFLRRPIGLERISSTQFSLSMMHGVRWARTTPQEFVVIRTIVVEEQYRGQGYARAVFEYLASKNVNLFVEHVTSTKLKTLLKKLKFSTSRTLNGHVNMYKLAKG